MSPPNRRRISTSKDLQELLEAQKDRFVGAAIAVISKDRTIETATYGRPNLEDAAAGPVISFTPFSIGSNAKVLTATLVCQLVDAGKLALDDKLSKHLPEAAPICSPENEPTIRQLLSHSAGLVDLFETIDDIDDLVAKLANHGPLARPGALFSYSNAGYALLGALLQKLTGLSWEKLVRTKVVESLGLHHIFLGDEHEPRSPEDRTAMDYDFKDNGDPEQKQMYPRFPELLAAAGTTLEASIDDMSTIFAEILFGNRLITESMRKEMQTLQISMPGPSLFCDGWGLGWSAISPGVLGHMGGSSTLVTADVKAGKAALLLLNTPNVPDIAGPIFKSVLGLEPFSEPSTKTGEQSWNPEILGSYTSPLFSFDISSKNSRLNVGSPLAPNMSLELAQHSETCFLGPLGKLKTEYNFTTVDGQRYLHCGLRALKSCPKKL